MEGLLGEGTEVYVALQRSCRRKRGSLRGNGQSLSLKAELRSSAQSSAQSPETKMSGS